MILQYYMVRDNVKPPLRSNPSDAGLNLRWNPDDEEVTSTTVMTRARAYYSELVASWLFPMGA